MPTAGFAQNNASLSGRVIDESGAGLDAIVSISGPSALVRRASTLPDGTFAISGLPAGDYLICAEATIESQNRDPFVNSCFWLNPTDIPLPLTAGKTLTGFWCACNAATGWLCKSVTRITCCRLPLERTQAMLSL